MEDIPPVVKSVESAPPPPVAPEPPWPEEELARKKALVPYRSFRPVLQRALRCAECILARPTFDGEDPAFTLKEIETCTGIQSANIFKQVEGVVSNGWLQKEAAPSTFLYSSTSRPKIYKPIANSDGEKLLLPQPKPGCERNAGHLALEFITPQQARILVSLVNYLSERTAAGMSLTQAEIRSLNPDMTMDAVADMFRTLRRTNHITVVKEGGVAKAAVYEPTDRGLWLFDQIHPNLRQSYEPQAVEASNLHAVLLEKIQEMYQPEGHKLILQTIVEHLNLGILRGGVSDQNYKGFKAAKSETLEFTPRAYAIIGSKGELAVAHYLRLDPLVIGRFWRPSEVKSVLGAPENMQLSTFIKMRYYHPLRQAIQQQKLRP